jgi:hypothetical protein
MVSKLKVFVAHSFEEKPPRGENISDLDILNWFVKLMRRRPLSFSVITGSKPAPGPIDEKITTDIAECSCVIGIFTRRHHDKERDTWLPPQFVLCECASAIGFYYNTNKVICGFYEEGIDPKDLALITIGGQELVKFNRNELEKDKERFLEYLRKLPDIVASGTYREGQIALFKPFPYVQQRLYKIYTIYRNGNFTIQNLNTMLITDVGRFLSEEDGQITHEIWHRKADIPPLAEMLDTPVNERRGKAFMSGILRSINQKKINTPLRITPKDHEGKRSFFSVTFCDRNWTKLRLKNQDTIRYQYAWGLPVAYPACEEELADALAGIEINEDAYCIAEVFASHGLIRNLMFELRFERGKGTFFSKSPFFQTTSTFGDHPSWSLAEDMPLIEEEDHEMWFETFRIVERNFNGRMRVMWRPISTKGRAEQTKD